MGGGEGGEGVEVEEEIFSGEAAILQPLNASSVLGGGWFLREEKAGKKEEEEASE